VLRVLVGLWCGGWLLVSMSAVFMLDACAGEVVAPATCERAITWALLIVIVAQVAVLVVALVFSDPDRRSRTQAMALTLGAVAPVALNVVLYLVGYSVGFDR